MDQIYKNTFRDIIDINDVKEKYFLGWKLDSIAKKSKCSYAQIQKIIYNETSYRRPHVYKHKINHDYFDNIDDEHKAYWLGFLCADGCVHKKASQITISLQVKDKKILEILKKDLESDSLIKTYDVDNGKYCIISFFSKKLRNSLILHGCVPLKSERLKWVGKNINDNLISHFVRGYFDGDGHFGFWLHKRKYLKPHFNITSTYEFCNGLDGFIKNMFGYKFYMSKRHKNSNSVNRTIELSGAKQIINILNWIYKDSTIFLERKKEKFNSFLKLREKQGL